MRKFWLPLFLFLSTLLQAGETIPIKIDDEVFKKLKMSLVSVENPKDSEKLTFTLQVKANVGAKDSIKIGKIYLFIDNKNRLLKSEIKDEIATIIFELPKNEFENAKLYFSYPNGSICPESYSLDLKK